MRILKTLSIAVVLLFLANSLPAFSQDRDENRPGQGQEEKDKAKKDDKAAKQEDKAKQDEQKRDKDRPGAQQEERKDHTESTRQEQQKEQRPEEKMERGEHQHAAAGKGKRIPDDKFRAHFGRQHTFHVQRTQVINVAQPVVVYGGYSFQIVDVWPAEWGFDDDCYIDYVDGEYFLFDVFHPGIRVAVFVVE